MEKSKADGKGKVDEQHETAIQVAWASPSNIALVKYWGKLPGQTPMNPSISFVLKESLIRIYLNYRHCEAAQAGLQHFVFNGLPNDDFKLRFGKFLDAMGIYFPFLKRMTLAIATESTFPHSAGIASSAAAYSALALCLCSMEKQITGQNEPIMGINGVRKASFIARLGSGSACRSLENGFVVWGKTDLLTGSSNDYAVKVPDADIHPVFHSLRDAILIIDDKAKKVSSSAGHALMKEHAYRETRKFQANANLEKMMQALKSGNEDDFFSVLENEALSLHSLMMSSVPGYILMKSATINVLEKIHEFKSWSGIKLGFTMDAGPNIHLLYFERDYQQVKQFIEQELATHCSSRRWIDDSIGSGPSGI